MVTLSEIRPTERHRIYDIVSEAGVDVSDWANIKGGRAKAAVNPKYCYEWSFIQPGKVVVLNLWHPELQESDGVIWRGLNLRQSALRSESIPNRRRRAINMDQHIQTAYLEQLPIRVALLDGTIRKANDPSGKPSHATKRVLDPEPWAVTEYDWATGECTVTRGTKPEPVTSTEIDQELEAFEGAKRRLFVFHRQRERKLRHQKIADAMRTNNGRLICEVPHCEFDFVARYGELGKGFAHVHHLAQLSDAPKTGRKVFLKDLAVVCANCHAMIHRGGECRPLESLIPLAKRYAPPAHVPGNPTLESPTAPPVGATAPRRAD